MSRDAPCLDASGGFSIAVMGRLSMRTSAVVVGGGLLFLMGIVGWRLRSASQPGVESTFVRYEYDAIVLKIANRTSSRFIVSGMLSTSLDPAAQIVQEHSEIELHTSRRKLTELPFPPKLDIFCAPLPSASSLRRRAVAVLKAAGIDIVGTNLVMSVDLPSFDSVRMKP